MDPTQIPVALTAIGQLQATLSTMVSLLNEATVLVNNNWVVTLSSGVTITLEADQQASILAQYQTLKTQLATTYQTLP